MRSLFLHIGFHKTGSSSLQLALHNHRQGLKAQGFEFLALGKKGNSSGAVDVSLNDGELSFSLNDRLTKLLSDSRGDRVIVSAEHLCYLTQPADIQRLATLCRQYFDEVRVVAYLRRQDLQAISFKQQGARGVEVGRSSSSKLFGHAEGALPALTPAVRGYYDYFAKLCLWEEAFGREALVVRDFEPDSLQGGDLVTDFAAILGDGVELPSARVNEAVCRKEALWTHKLLELGVAPADIRKLKPGMRDCDAATKMLPSRADAQAFFLAFAESNRQLNDRFLGHRSGMAFSDDFSRFPVTGNDQITATDLAAWVPDLFSTQVSDPVALRDLLLSDWCKGGAAYKVDAATLKSFADCLSGTARAPLVAEPWYRRLRKKRSGR